MVPEFAALLAVPPDPGDPLTAQARAQRSAVEMLRAVASRKRPVVLFVDDLQWAGRTPLGLVDLVLQRGADRGSVAGRRLPRRRRGRGASAGGAAVAVARAGRRCGTCGWTTCRVPSLVTMVAEMLHVDPAAAAGLAELIEPHTAGNPYETVELLNALRRDGVLTRDGGRVAVGRRRPCAPTWAGSEVAGLLAARVEAMPRATRAMLEAMACLGGRAELSLLQAATGASAGVVEQGLAPALDEGLLVVEPGAHEAVRFRHDRIREAVLARAGPAAAARPAARHGAAAGAVPELFAVAAEQYLPVVDAVDDAAERRAVVELLRRAADQARDDRRPRAGERAAGRRAAADRPGRDRHAGRGAHRPPRRAVQPGPPGRGGRGVPHDRGAVRHRAGPRERDGGAGAQPDQPEPLRRGDRPGRRSRCGSSASPSRPRTGSPAEIDRQFGHLYRWLDDTDAADDLARPERHRPGAARRAAG